MVNIRIPHDINPQDSFKNPKPQVLEALGIQMLDRDKLRKLVHVYDEDESGQLDFPELIELLKCEYPSEYELIGALDFRLQREDQRRRARKAKAGGVGMLLIKC
jgi:Ca2+-binding EF-hand superfamily protein